MTAGLLLTEEEIKPVSVDGEIGEELTYAEDLFRLVWPPDNELLFYDWVAEGNEITGLELHISEEPEVLAFHTFLRSRSYISYRPFPIIWLRRQHLGESLGLEEFGDIAILRSDRDKWAIVIGSIPEKVTDIK